MLRYGLKRNPFGIGQPPKYKEEGWCFVDLKLEDGTFEIVFSQDEEKIIDRSEQALMRANQPAIRDAISQYLSEYTKKKVI